MQKAKVICICGSLKFIDKIQVVSEELALAGNCVLSIVYPTRPNLADYSQTDLRLLGELHRQRITMADAIFVVNVDGYLGEHTKGEIALAQQLQKEIIYLENSPRLG